VTRSVLPGLDLFGENVGVAGVAGGFGDHPQVDEPKAHRSDDVVLGDVVEVESGG
jgi:hypothetical protein